MVETAHAKHLQSSTAKACCSSKMSLAGLVSNAKATLAASMMKERGCTVF